MGELEGFIHFSNKAAFFSIAIAIGNPLKIDEATANLMRPSVAQVCIEVDFLKHSSQRIWIGTGAASRFWQDVCYENLPPYCSHCLKMGHSSSHCRIIVGTNDSNGKKAAAAPSTSTAKASWPSEDAPSVADKSAISDKEQWVPKAASAVSTAASPTTTKHTSEIAAENAVQFTVAVAEPPLFKDAAGTSQDAGVVEVLEMPNKNAETIQEGTLQQAPGNLLYGAAVA